MQTLTFLREATVARHSWRTLSIVLFFLLGLCAQVVQAQVTLSNQAVTVNQGNGNNTYGETAFDNSTLVDQQPGSTTTPKFDINNGTLILNGGTLTTAETGTSVVNGASILYTLYDPSGNPVTAPGGAGSIILTQTSVNGGVRTFSNTGAAISLLPLTNAGDGYSVAVTFQAMYRNGGAGRTLSKTDDNGGNGGYIASFDVVGTRTPPPTVTPNTIQIAPDGGSDTSYYFPNTGTNPQFPGYNFTSSQNAGGTAGAFDINTGQLRLDNTTVTTTEAGNNTVGNVVLYYRTRLANSSGGAFQAITLTQSGGVSNGTRTFIVDPASNNNNPQPNLIATPAVTAPGNYVVDIYYQANGSNSSTGNVFTVVYPPTGYSSATFTVGGTPIATTIWTGANNDNWFDPGNWSNGVPSKTTNALIRDLGAGNNVPYPNIYSDTVRTTAAGTVLYDNSKSGPAQTLNFTMGGSSQASRSIARLVEGQLQVFGNFDNSYDSFIQRESTIMEFASANNQTITGGSFGRVDISGGSTKTLNGVMNIAESLNFLTPTVYVNSGNPLKINPHTATAANAGVLATDITQPATILVQLADRSSANFNNGAQVNGETDSSFLYGFLRTTRQTVSVGEKRTYGNMGMTLTFTGTNSPGNVELTRNTVEAYAPGPNHFGIRRIFGVRPSDPATNSGGLKADMIFGYRNAETKNLNGPNTITPGTGSIPESRLTIFVSSNSGNTFQLIGRDAAPDSINNTVTRTGVTTFATFTLGDMLFPLPVTLVAFNATRSNDYALLTWTTATEESNKGFNIQVSADGLNFRTLAFVASQSPNSSTSLNYKYTDTENGKTGTRYYRLEQVDESGKTSYSPVRALSFDGAAASAVALVAYPNPFTDTIGLSLNGASVADGVAYVKLMDMTGRTVLDQKLSLVGASLSLGDLTALRSGLYLAKVTLPDGSTQTVRVQKQ